jgi:hypothetical protein
VGREVWQNVDGAYELALHGWQAAVSVDCPGRLPILPGGHLFGRAALPVVWRGTFAQRRDELRVAVVRAVVPLLAYVGRVLQLGARDTATAASAAFAQLARNVGERGPRLGEVQGWARHLRSMAGLTLRLPDTARILPRCARCALRGSGASGGCTGRARLALCGSGASGGRAGCAWLARQGRAGRARLTLGLPGSAFSAQCTAARALNRGLSLYLKYY